MSAGSLFMTPCACREMRIPYGCNVAADIHGAMHRATHCDGMKITLLPEPDATPKPPPWTGSVLCVSTASRGGSPAPTRLRSSLSRAAAALRARWRDGDR